MQGKEKCKALKEIRKKIAEENDIEYVVQKNKIDVIISKINVIMNLKEKIKFNINNNLLMDKLLIELEGCEQDD
jgi:hypothetical protein